MSRIKVGQENSTPIEIYYEDYGAGSPVVLLSGYPFTGASWEKQVPALLAAGHRVITLDRRGFGGSSRPSAGYDMDTFADDLEAVLAKLNLTGASLVGFSLGTGEIIRYIGKYGVARIRNVALLGTMGPFWVKTADNPEGADEAQFDGWQAALRADRATTLLGIIKGARNHDILGGTLVSDESVNAAWTVAVAASPLAAVESIAAMKTDFRADIPSITVPTLILHAGDADRVCPPNIHSRRLAKLIPGVKFIEFADAPHEIIFTHAAQVNAALIDFLR